MQISHGIRSFHALPVIYRLANAVFSSQAFSRWFLKEILAGAPGQKIVDIGCGPADILAQLDDAVSYVGLDISEAYIDAARQRYGQRGVFIAGTVEDWVSDPRIQNTDVVLAYGLLHHVGDSEATAILQFARDVLRPGGRLVFLEPCYLLWQSRRSVFMMSKDRGQNVRTEQEWKALATAVFPGATTSIVTNANRLGYTHIIGQCIK